MSDTLDLSKRKSHHLSFAEVSQTGIGTLNSYFNYEPILSGFPKNTLEEDTLSLSEKVEVRHRLWISSMTGGTSEAGAINKTLAKVAGEFGLGMGLGSCRPLLESNDYFEDFNLRPLMGSKGVLFANFGVAQVFSELHKDGARKLMEIVERLQVDGVFLHINPLQEWFQPEGDRWFQSPLQAIEELSQLLKAKKLLLGIKEVGQGMGPESLKALIEGPADIIEFGAYGGTNFSRLEFLRQEKANNSHEITKAEELCFVGHPAEEMVRLVNRILNNADQAEAQKTFIISGGIRSFLHGHYLVENLAGKGLYAMAKPFLQAALGGEEELRSFVRSQLEGLTMARAFLKAKPLGLERGGH